MIFQSTLQFSFIDLATIYNYVFITIHKIELNFVIA